MTKCLINVASAYFLAALLSACASQGGSGGLPTLNGLNVGSPVKPTSIRDHSIYKVVFTFNGNDGAYPDQVPIAADGALYGTTIGGGGYAKLRVHRCCRRRGVAYSVSTVGKEHVLHQFGHPAGDGKYPRGSLIGINGSFYGVTWGGGSRSKGTVFTLNGSGEEHVIYNFRGHPADGANPVAGLTEVFGNLYGTTLQGGSSCSRPGCGSVFKITTSGAETVLHNFKGKPDGQAPAAALIDDRGTLYGTTRSGGISNDGTIFSVTPSGRERVIHSFGSDRDGGNPEASLTFLEGALYGTTEGGGTYGKGTVFSVSTSGSEHVIYNFGSGSDGANPVAALVVLNGVLYGTTPQGGAAGNGTVFSVTKAGKENVLHSFSGSSGSDGFNPEAPLLVLNGFSLGLRITGGSSSQSCGTIFRIDSLAQRQEQLRG